MLLFQMGALPLEGRRARYCQGSYRSLTNCVDITERTLTTIKVGARYLEKPPARCSSAAEFSETCILNGLER